MYSPVVIPSSTPVTSFSTTPTQVGRTFTSAALSCATGVTMAKLKGTSSLGEEETLTSTHALDCGRAAHRPCMSICSKDTSLILNQAPLAAAVTYREQMGDIHTTVAVLTVRL